MTKDLKPGDVVQIDIPGTAFHECFMIVTEPKTWGAQGMVKVPNAVDAYFGHGTSSCT